MSSLLSYLPQHDGILPKWLLFVSSCRRTLKYLKMLTSFPLQVSLVSVLNSAQAYSTLHYTQRVYSGSSSLPKTPASTASPVTPLSARTFGTWTFISSVIRLYAAYHISNPQVYQLALWTYGIAWAHFMSEWWVFGTTKWGAGLAGPVFVSTGSLIWMGLQWGYYVQ
jgi:hypothetical protein